MDRARGKLPVRFFGAAAALLLFAAPAGAGEWSVEDFMRQNRIGSVEAALDWEAKNLRYAPEDGIAWRWQSSRLALDSRRPNCQGYASLNFEVLQKLGYRPAIYSFQSGMGSEAERHALVVFEMGGRWRAVSNEILLSSEEKTLEAFFFWLAANHHYHFPVLKRSS